MEVTEWRSQERVRSSKGHQEALPKRRPYKRALQKGPPKRLSKGTLEGPKDSSKRALLKVPTKRKS